MSPRQKVIFLTNIVPFFGSSDQLSLYPDLLSEVIEIIQKRLPDEAIGSVQDFASDILITDFLSSQSPDAAKRVVRYLQSLSVNDLKAFVTEDRQTKVK
jgi:hypothetical protein